MNEVRQGAATRDSYLTSVRSSSTVSLRRPKRVVCRPGRSPRRPDGDDKAVAAMPRPVFAKQSESTQLIISAIPTAGK